MLSQARYVSSRPLIAATAMEGPAGEGGAGRLQIRTNKHCTIIAGKHRVASGTQSTPREAAHAAGLTCRAHEADFLQIARRYVRMLRGQLSAGRLGPPAFFLTPQVPLRAPLRLHQSRQHGEFALLFQHAAG